MVESETIDGDAPLMLRGWQVFELDRQGRERTRHMVGFTGKEGRVSSAVVRFDASTGRAVSSSGRVYQLRGVPGMGLDAEYTWREWCSREQPTEVVDVTSDVRRALEDAGVLRVFRREKA